MKAAVDEYLQFLVGTKLAIIGYPPPWGLRLFVRLMTIEWRDYKFPMPVATSFLDFEIHEVQSSLETGTEVEKCGLDARFHKFLCIFVMGFLLSECRITGFHFITHICKGESFNGNTKTREFF